MNLNPLYDFIVVVLSGLFKDINIEKSKAMDVVYKATFQKFTVAEDVEFEREDFDALFEEAWCSGMQKVNPERFCLHICHGKNAVYDRSETEGPCFHCDIMEQG
jgi:hypothetical protein